MSQIKEIVKWMADAGQSVDRRNFDQMRTYLRLCCEELGEGIYEVGPDILRDHPLPSIRDWLKDNHRGVAAHKVEAANPHEILDSAVDLIWVAVGLIASMGVDPEEALAEVIRSNNSKRNRDGTLSMDATGKIVKGLNFSPPDFTAILEKVK